MSKVWNPCQLGPVVPVGKQPILDKVLLTSGAIFFSRNPPKSPKLRNELCIKAGGQEQSRPGCERFPYWIFLKHCTISARHTWSLLTEKDWNSLTQFLINRLETNSLLVCVINKMVMVRQLEVNEREETWGRKVEDNQGLPQTLWDLYILCICHTENYS